MVGLIPLEDDILVRIQVSQQCRQITILGVFAKGENKLLIEYFYLKSAYSQI